jgi:hypothetical protein
VRPVRELAQSDATAAVTAALIAAAVSLAVAVLTQLGLVRRDRAERRYHRRRTALLEVQDAALSLRLRLSEYGALSRRHPGHRTPETTEAERQFDQARGLLEVALSRVEDRIVLARVTEWRAKAQVISISSDDEVTVRQEETAWHDLNAAVGRALASRSGSTD